MGEVVQALNQPEKYVEKWEVRLANRGIMEPIPELAWIALVDALDEQGLVNKECSLCCLNPQK